MKAESKQTYSEFTDHMCTRVCFLHYVSCLITIHLKKIIFKITIMYFYMASELFFKCSFQTIFFLTHIFLHSQILALTEQNNIGGKAAISNDFSAWKV